jgi:hypothetical protein
VVTNYFVNTPRDFTLDRLAAGARNPASEAWRETQRRTRGAEAAAEPSDQRRGRSITSGPLDHVVAFDLVEAFDQMIASRTVRTMARPVRGAELRYRRRILARGRPPLRMIGSKGRQAGRRGRPSPPTVHTVSSPTM